MKGVLFGGQQLSSPNGQHHAILQFDGNFVVYHTTNFTPSNAKFHSNTSGGGMAPFKLIPQSDGNLCLYDSTNKCIWSASTWQAEGMRKRPYSLVMQNDGNLVLYDSGNTPLWYSLKFPMQQGMGKFKRFKMGKAKLKQNKDLKQNEMLASKNGKYHATMQTDGNFVVYQGQFTPMNAKWSTQSNGKGFGPYRFICQSDGNMCVYDANNTPTWCSQTYGKGKEPYHLKLKDDGELELIDAHKHEVWSSTKGFSQHHPHQQAPQMGFPQPQMGFPQMGMGMGMGYQQPMPSMGDTLYSEGKLMAEQFLASKNQMYFAKLQNDGNLVVFRTSNFIPTNACWNSQTNGRGTPGHFLQNQPDGNLVLYDGSKTPLWNNGGYGKGKAPYRLVMQDDGNLVWYDSMNTPIWHIK
jgi:hypothetical protein